MFSITWSPYYLDYNSSARSVEKSALAEVKLGSISQEQRSALAQRVGRAGQAVGITFKWGGKIGRTCDAHRLVYLARFEPQGVQQALVEKLFEGYHQREMDISSRVVLCELAAEAGLDRFQTQDRLMSEEGLAEVDQAAAENKKQYRDSGVPTYLIQNAHRVSGVEDVSYFLDLFVKIKKDDI